MFDLFKKKEEVSCGDQPGPQQTLCDVCNDLTVCVKELSGDPEICHRLREMGFQEETEVTKISHSGAVIACVNGCKIIISESLAKKIMVGDIELASARMEILLSQLTAGQKAEVLSFTEDSDDAQRIEEMGVTPGEMIEIVRTAPMGDPIEIRVRGYLLMLRKEEAELVRVILKK